MHRNVVNGLRDIFLITYGGNVDSIRRTCRGRFVVADYRGQPWFLSWRRRSGMGPLQLAGTEVLEVWVHVDHHDEGSTTDSSGFNLY